MNENEMTALASMIADRMIRSEYEFDAMLDECDRFNDPIRSQIMLALEICPIHRCDLESCDDDSYCALNHDDASNDLIAYEICEYSRSCDEFRLLLSILIPSA